jgi:hypothetical protein
MPALAGTGGYGSSPDECGYDPLSDNGMVLMAVPKRKTTRSKKRMRHTHKYVWVGFPTWKLNTSGGKQSKLKGDGRKDGGRVGDIGHCLRWCIASLRKAI